MEQINSTQFIQKFLEAGEQYGLCSVFEGTFGGRLLHDADTSQFVWFSDEEYEDAVNEVIKPAHLIQAHRCLCDDD